MKNLNTKKPHENNNDSFKRTKICKDVQKSFLVLIDKDHQPKWNPGTLQDVTTEKVDSYFESLGENELQF
jgi:hypothetical protein